MTTTAEKIRVMQAFENGQEIQMKSSGNWFDPSAAEPIWCWERYEYRIKPADPEPLECWITLNEKGRIKPKWRKPIEFLVIPQDEQDRQEDIEFRLWKQDRAEKQKKRGDYWLTKEGRAELKECFTDPNDGNAVRPLLDALEKLEKCQAGLFR